MSNFYCEHCGDACYDSPQGYTTGCQHYLPDTASFKLLLWRLGHVVKNPKEFVTRPMGCGPGSEFQLHDYGQASLLDLWNAGQYDECETIVYRLTSGDPY